METAVPTLRAYLDQPLEVGKPDVAGPLALFPLFGPEARLEYQSFAQGCAHGVTIKELDGGASVRDLVVANPTSVPVLLFEGEEVLGAQQNRTFDVSVLVGAQSTLRVPVSCVEAQRWDGRRRAEAFGPAPHAAHPRLRRMKNAQAAVQLAAGQDPRADQGAVWAEVDERLHALAAHAPTRALHDGFAARATELRGLTGGLSMKSGQTGMLVAIGDEFVVLDRVSQPNVLDSLFEPLVRGYALDALGACEVEPPTRGEAEALMSRVFSADVVERDGIGAGRDVRLRDGDLTGAGIVSGSELIQLSVFVHRADDQAPQPIRAGRIRRPSRRRC
jgi:hypothetical protein